MNDKFIKIPLQNQWRVKYWQRVTEEHDKSPRKCAKKIKFLNSENLELFVRL